MSKSARALEQELEELKQKLVVFKHERNKLRMEARRWAKKRNKNHEQIRALRTAAITLRESRDAVNRSVKNAKASREQAQKNRKEIHIQILKTREKAKRLSKKRPNMNLKDIQQKIESFEWKIQTMSLSIKEEMMLINRIRALEAQRIAYKKLQALEAELINLRTREKALEVKGKTAHDELSKLAAESQNIHEKMLATLNEGHKLKVEAEGAHQKYLKLHEKANELHLKCIEFTQKIKIIKENIEKREKKQQIKRLQALQEEAVKKAQEKKKRGEKLTFDEFKLLTERRAS